MTRIFLIGVLSVVVLPTSRAGADPILVVGYDITNAIVSGSGNWGHTYNGTITPTTVPGVNSLVANYSGGGGTLNDGVIGHSVLDTQLFDVAANSVITLFLSDVSRVNEIDLFGGDIPANSVPGSLRGVVTVSANGLTADVMTLPFGRRSVIGIPVNDRLSLTGSPLQGILTDRITLSGFRSEFLDRTPIGSYSLTEITIGGPGPALPEPATLTLLATGLIGAVCRRRKVAKP